MTEDFRRTQSPGRVRALLVAGSGLSFEIRGWNRAETIPLQDIVPFPVHALPGHDHSMTLFRRDGDTLLVMNGRFHLYQGYSAAEVVAPVRLAALLGAELMIATNASGAVDPEIPAGAVVVVSDHLNLMGANPNTGEWGREMGPQFPDMSEAYDTDLRSKGRSHAAEAGFEVFEGVYAAVAGPTFETPAEIRMLRGLGASVVGMSTVPEVIAARHMGMKVLVLSLATNAAAGLTSQPLDHQEVLEAGRQAADKLHRLLSGLIEEIL